MRLLKLAPAIALGGAHFIVHFTVPMLDLILHGAFFLALYLGARSNA